MTNNTCLFCRIAARHLPAHLVYKSSNVLAFLDIRSIRTGHMQIILCEHIVEQEITFQDRPRVSDPELSATAKSLRLLLQK